MSAKNLHRSNEEGTYSHIYNKGAEKRIIFNDDGDYQVFLGFLKDYLSAPQDPDSIKKDFKVHGRVFRGTPHQPKNYFKQVELIAYSLLPDHFHLFLHQITKGSLENFIRSLCTRYSIYFNKKYQHTGAVFEGPYKSVQIRDESRLLHLTRYIHLSPKENGMDITSGYSSYPEYLGTRETSWVKPKHILSLLGNRTSDYQNFVEKYELDQKEKELLEGIAFDSKSQLLERRDLASSEGKPLNQDLKPRIRKPQFFAASTLVFLVLFSLGIRNITISAAKSSQPTTSPVSSSPNTEVLGQTAQISTAPAVPADEAVKPETKTKAILTVKVEGESSESSIVNIRAKPTTDSEKIGEAKDGDTFEFVSLDSGWYEAKLADGTTGFILAKYVLKEEQNN